MRSVTALRFWVLLLVAGLFAALNTAAMAAGIRVQQAKIMDNNGFDRPMVAAEIMVLEGMRIQGGVRWRTKLNDCPDGYTIDWQAISQDGAWTMTIIPEERWGHSSSGQPVAKACHDSSISSARAFLKAWVEQYRSGARILDYRDRLDLEQESASRNRQQTIGTMRMNTRSDAGEVLIAYSQNGQDLREAVVVVVVVTETLFDSMGVGPNRKTIFGYSLPGFAMRAPAGQLNFANMEKLRKSIKAAPAWSAKIAQHTQVMNRQNIEHIGKLGDINRKSGEDINNIITSGYAKRNAVKERGRREVIEGIRGTETWNTPGGGTRELQDSRNAWQLDNGNFVTSDDPNWRPSDSGLSGRQLQRTQ